MNEANYFGLGILLGVLLSRAVQYLNQAEGEMPPTIEPPPVPACEWCRMGLHKKCDKLTKVHAICVCDCERGY